MKMIEETNPRKEALYYLSNLHPMKADEVLLIDSVNTDTGIAKETILEALNGLVDEGLVERTVSINGTEGRKLALTPKGKEKVDSFPAEEGQGIISPREIESRLISTYDRMKGDMEVIRQNLEKNHRILEADMSGIRKSMAEHDQFVRTYMVRIVESISMFIGIFAIVVVMMVNVLSGMSEIGDMNMFILFVITLPFLLIVTIIPGLWLVRRTILEPPAKA